MTELLRQTLRHLVQLPDHEFELASLLGSIGDDAALKQVADEELAPRNGHLELHLGGAKVEGHATVAKSFGQFVLQIAESVKATVKDISGSARLQDELLIEAGPGSVKATFIAPVRRSEQTELQFTESLDEVLAEDDGYSEALRRVATVLAHSDPESPNDLALDAAIGLIPAESRAPFKRALDEAQRQSWSIEGSFVQRGLGVTPVHVKPAAVQFLRDRLKETVVTREPLESTGSLDGHTWSTGTMRFIPTGGRRPIVASFANSRVQLEVGRLDSVPDQRVRARFTVITTSGLANTRTAYVLDSIEAFVTEDVPRIFNQ